MKKIFVSNLRGFSSGGICRDLVRLGIMPMSPFHAFSFLDPVPAEFRKELIWGSDEVWLFGEWEKSQEGQEDRETALAVVIPVRIVTGWGDGVLTFTSKPPEWMRRGDYAGA